MQLLAIERLRRALRFFWREPGFAAHAALILALGIGATSAVFSLVQGALLTPPPYSDPERIVVITPTAADERLAAAQRGAWPALQWEEWQRSAESFDAVAAYGWTFNFLVLEDGSESEEGLWVSPRYFDVTGLEPALGRRFIDADTAEAQTSTIILGHDLWLRQFNGDPEIVGKTVRLSRDRPRTVVGVMPAGVRFLPTPAVAGEPNYNLNAKADFWLPIGRNTDPQRSAVPNFNVVARLRDGVTPGAAKNELALIGAQLAESTPALAKIRAEITPLTDVLNVDGRRILLPLLAAAALVLLISCGNAAALLLVRGLQRHHEYGVRSAIGAGRGALFKHVLAESLLLAVLGGALGVPLGAGIVMLFKSVAGQAIPRLDAVTIGWPVLAFGVGAALLACALAGLFPAWRASTLDPVEALRDNAAKGSAGRGQRNVLAWVLVAQMALTLALLVGAGLLTRTMYNLTSLQSGYDTHNVVTMSVTAFDTDWADFHGRALEAVAALPGVERTAFAWGVPLTGNGWPNGVQIEGYTPPSGGDARVPLTLRAVTPGYFELLGETIEEGRDIRLSDTLPPRPPDAAPNTPPDFSAMKAVTVVNRAFVDRYLGGTSALGKKIFMQAGPTRVPVEIVGVVSNSRTDDLARAPEPEVYMSLFQNQAFSKHLVVRTTADPDTIAAEVRRALRAIAPTAAVENLQTLDEIREDSLAGRTFAMQLLVGFAAVASVLTLAGFYSVLSLFVASRRREIAIRSAVGAGRSAILRLVLRDGLTLAGIGIIAGLGAAFALSTLLRTLLFEVSPADPVTLVGAVAAFGVVAALACWVPASRATRVSPAEALKSE